MMRIWGGSAIHHAVSYKPVFKEDVHHKLVKVQTSVVWYYYWYYHTPVSRRLKTVLFSPVIMPFY